MARRTALPALAAVAGVAVLVQLATTAAAAAAAAAERPPNLEYGAKWLAGPDLPGPPDGCTPALRRQIRWGTGTSAMQVEGATNAGGRTDSVWDAAVRKDGKLIADRSTPFLATDHHGRYREDFRLMRELGIKHYRFSISWSRLLPRAVSGSAVSPEGAKFYGDFIDAMLKEGIQPAVTLYHWDLPQVLQDEYSGFMDSERFVRDFSYYAETAYKLYGDRVKAWVTFNEPWITCGLQYGGGGFPPSQNLGDAARFRCGHNLLRAHAAAVKLYRSQYKPQQGGVIGMAMWTEWSEPWRAGNAGDARAAQNKMDVDISWFADPIHFGDYPQKLKDSFAADLPVFTPAEKSDLKKSYDYFGITFYTGKWAAERPDNPGGWEVKLVDPSGKRVGDQAESYWLNDVPWSLTSMLKYINDRYDAPEIWVMENGFSEKGESKRYSGSAAALKDPARVKYFRGYTSAACKSRAAGIKLARFYTWSFMDNWEWKEGFGTDFGIVDVDFANATLPRRPKDSARWLRTYIFPYAPV